MVESEGEPPPGRVLAVVAGMPVAGSMGVLCRRGADNDGSASRPRAAASPRLRAAAYGWQHLGYG